MEQISTHDYASAFLIPEFTYTKDTRAWVKKNWKALFENLLFEWSEDKKTWPKNRNWKMFNEFFDVKWESMVLDTVTKPIRREKV